MSKSDNNWFRHSRNFFVIKAKSYGLNSIILDKGNFIGGRISTKEVEII